jgi:FtsH-binding integral membrane protein
MLLVAGGAIGSLPFIGRLRALPRWIRRAQCLVGITFITGAMLGFGLYSAGDRISYRLHQFIFFHIVLLVGMGLGMVLLVLVSGEYFKALRALDAARRERLAASTRSSASENV